MGLPAVLGVLYPTRHWLVEAFQFEALRFGYLELNVIWFRYVRKWAIIGLFKRCYWYAVKLKLWLYFVNALHPCPELNAVPATILLEVLETFDFCLMHNNSMLDSFLFILRLRYLTLGTWYRGVYRAFSLGAWYLILRILTIRLFWTCVLNSGNFR